MKLNTKKIILNFLLASCLLFSMAGNALADIDLDDFTSSDGTDGLGDAKPLMLEVVSFVVGLFLLTCIIAIFASGSIANIGNMVHNASLRSKGLAGVMTVLGVVFAVIICLVLFFHFYNKYIA